MEISPFSQIKLPRKESRNGWRYGISALLLSVALFSVAFALLRLQWAVPIETFPPQLTPPILFRCAAFVAALSALGCALGTILGRTSAFVGALIGAGLGLINIPLYLACLAMGAL